MSITNNFNLEEQLILKVAVNAFKYNTINEHIVTKNDVAKIDWDKFITLAIDQSSFWRAVAKAGAGSHVLSGCKPLYLR